MPNDTDSIRGRVDHATSRLTPMQMGLGLAFVAAVGFTLLFVQEPMMHDALHNFRHGAGITCH